MELVGKELFPDFKDPLQATSLEIVKFDEKTASLQPFKVALANNRWSIPSHENYPADAKDHLAEAAASLMGLKVLEVASESPGDHGMFGVIAPDPKTLKGGETGVGMRVVMTDKDGKELLNLIIGKEVPGQEGLRYIRRGDQDPVYVVALKTDKLSTRFEDWIEKDLLQLNTWDVKRVSISDYSIDIVQGAQIPRSDLVVEYDDKDAKWSLVDCRVFETGRWQTRLLAEDEELDTAKLNDMKWALDDLKIVDVRRKPAGLSKNLRDTGEIRVDQQTVQSLADRGFYIVRVGNRHELLSSEGEITVLMKDGVQYVLRFGGIAGTGEESQQTGEQNQQGSDASSSKPATGMNRYLFVMAEFNPEAIPKPDLEPLPELPPETQSSSGGSNSAGGSVPGTRNGADPAASGSAGQPSAASESSGNGHSGNGSGEDTAGPAADVPANSAQPASGAAETQGGTGVAGAAQQPAAESSGVPGSATTVTQSAAGGDSTGPQAATSTETSGEDQQKKIEQLKQERERIEKENKRKQEEYEEKIKRGQERVNQLNDRFADWYYIISDEVYRKIHLSRQDIIKKKTTSAASGGSSQPSASTSGTDASGSAAGGPQPTDTTETPEGQAAATAP